jgi:hypothetical protein
MIRRLFVCPDLMRVPKGKRIMSKKQKDEGTFIFRELTAEETLKEYGASFTWIGRPTRIQPKPKAATSKRRRQQNG